MKRKCERKHARRLSAHNNKIRIEKYNCIFLESRFTYALPNANPPHIVRKRIISLPASTNLTSSTTFSFPFVDSLRAPSPIRKLLPSVGCDSHWSRGKHNDRFTMYTVKFVAGKMLFDLSLFARLYFVSCSVSVSACMTSIFFENRSRRRICVSACGLRVDCMLTDECFTSMFNPMPKAHQS